MRKDYVTNLETLMYYFNSLPTGTTADIITSDLEAGNFDIAHLILPDGSKREIHYNGPVADGYVSPFEWQQEEEDLDK